jgi:hypothetical protein
LCDAYIILRKRLFPSFKLFVKTPWQTRGLLIRRPWITRPNLATTASLYRISNPILSSWVILFPQKGQNLYTKSPDLWQSTLAHSCIHFWSQSRGIQPVLISYNRCILPAFNTIEEQLSCSFPFSATSSSLLYSTYLYQDVILFYLLSKYDSKQ